MSIIDASVKKPVAMSMLLMIVMFLGIYASINLPVDFLPDIETPVLSVSTDYTGAGPEEIENAISRPLENVLSTVEGIDKISSSSSEGNSLIRLEFAWGTDLDTAMFNVREKIDLVRNDLPDGSDSPQIFKFSTDMIPVMGILLSGIDDLATAYDIAENQIKRSLEQVAGVGSVGVEGGLETEVQIELEQNRLQAYNIDAETIAQVVAANDLNIAGGYVYQGTYKYGVRTDGELKTLEDIRNIVITYRDETPIFLKDIATVRYGGNEDNPLMYVSAYNIDEEMNSKAGRGAVALYIRKSSGANTVEVEKAVQKKLKEIKKTLPPSVEISEMFNTAETITDSQKSVSSSAFSGAIFAIFVLFFYLWDWRSLLVIALSIPTSVITTFIVMMAFDTTFNIISMAGLALGVGMMVDSSIVVLENIFRHRAEGEGPYAASINGAKEVMLAITASTLTTIAVFAPIFLVEGMIAQLFRDLSITVVASLLSSLVISITLVPMLCSLLIKEVHMEGFESNEEDDTMSDEQESKLRFNERILHRIDVFYKGIIEYCVQHKKLIVFGGGGLSVLLLIILGSIVAKENMPTNDDGQFTVYLTYPLGTRVDYNETLSREILGQVKKAIGKDNLKIIGLTVKDKKTFFGNSEDHRSRLEVTLVPRSERSEDINAIVNRVRKVLAQYPVQNYIKIGGGMGGGSGGEPITIEVRGNDLDIVSKFSEQLIALMSTIDGIENPRLTTDGGVPEVVLRPDRVALARAGLSPINLFQSIRTSFGGRVATRILGTTGNDIDVRVRVRDEDRTSIDSLLNLNIPTPDGAIVPFKTLVSSEQRMGPSSIERIESIRYLEIKSGTSGRFAKDISQAVEEIQKEISQKLFIPSGIQIIYSGDFEEGNESRFGLFMAFIAAIFIVYALMAAQFESYIAPFVIMASVPFGALGAIIALIISGKSLNTISSAGIVVLVGIVINNGIVLIDYMNQLLIKGMDVDKAAVEAGVRRIRPVFMTTLTTILGMIPMALGLGEGGETYAPLATSVLGGLILSTMFTLVIVPTAYAGIRKRFPIIIRED